MHKKNHILKFEAKNLEHSKFLPGISVFFFLVKLTGDIFFFVATNFNSPIILLWKFLSLSAVTIPMYLYLKKKNDEYIDNAANPSEDFLQDFRALLFVALALVISIAFLPNFHSTLSEPKNLATFLLMEIICTYGLIAGMYSFKFLHKWFIVRRHNNTMKHLKILFYLTLFVVFSDVVFFRIHEDFTVAVNAIIMVYLFLLILMISKKTKWIALLPKKQKIRMIYHSALFLLLTIIFMGMSGEKNSNYEIAFMNYFPGTGTLLFLSLFYLFVFTLRNIYSAFVSLPTSDIVDRHTYEISSLTYLNNIIAKNIEIDEILNSVVRIAREATQSELAIIFVYDKEEKLVFDSESDTLIREIRKEGEFIKSLIKANYELELIPEIKNSGILKPIFENLLPIASAIYCPLFKDDKHVGGIIVVNTEEYSLDADDVNLLSAFRDNIEIALENSGLIIEAIEGERLKRELKIAREMQQKLLPVKLPEIENFTIDAFSNPAEEVGGDYYDIVKLNNGNYCIVIADVSGKGMTAAFYMAQLKGIVLSQAGNSKSPGELLSRINKTLYGSLERNSFITVSALEIKNTNELVYARAGHLPMIIKCGEEIQTLKPNGLGTGLAADSIFDDIIEETKIEIKNECSIILFTDGLNEARNYNGDEFGFERISDVLSTGKYMNAPELNEALFKKLNVHLGGEKHHDDITVITMMAINSGIEFDILN